jgi:hypothetical protein
MVPRAVAARTEALDSEGAPLCVLFELRGGHAEKPSVHSVSVTNVELAELANFLTSRVGREVAKRLKAIAAVRSVVSFNPADRSSWDYRFSTKTAKLSGRVRVTCSLFQADDNRVVFQTRSDEKLEPEMSINVAFERVSTVSTALTEFLVLEFLGREFRRRSINEITALPSHLFSSISTDPLAQGLLMQVFRQLLTTAASRPDNASQFLKAISASLEDMISAETEPEIKTPLVFSATNVNRLPDTPIEYYAKRADQNESIIDFLRRVWFPWIKAGLLTRPAFRKLDPVGEKALQNWLHNHPGKMPEDLRLPTKSDIVEEQLSKADAETIRQAQRLAKARQRRAKAVTG